MRVLVLGGRGNFGARIVRALAGEPEMEVLVGGRPDLALDAPNFARNLAALKPSLVIHCVGPFQGQDYRVALASLAAGAHYLDLADGRDFVAGFSTAVDEAAKRAGKLALTGVSTLPALSSAVVDHLRVGFSALHAIDCVIAPGQHAPRGEATLAAVMSYAGRPFTVWNEGAWREVHGWRGLEWREVHPLVPRLSAYCDVPDLELFPQRYDGVKRVVFRAALEIAIQHRGLAMLAWLRQWGLPLPIEKLARPMECAAQLLDRLGSGNGAMNVVLEAQGQDGRARKVRWHVHAPNNHGPEIPCMAAILLARKLARGELSATGAAPCMGWLSLDEFAPQFAKWNMTTGVTELETR
ncbi:MAG: saccharopine dehydrogenase [Betaproteobacteria bacterium]|nr:saccharopine dehydrogenase [Betaproteobacteria bacterium]